MNFGWLFPVLLDDISVPEPQAEEKPPEETTEPAPESGAKGSPEDEASATGWWDKAEKLEGAGQAPRALIFYRKIVELGKTSFLERAKAKIAELE